MDTKVRDGRDIAHPIRPHRLVSWMFDCASAGSNPTATIAVTGEQTCWAAFE